MDRYVTEVLAKLARLYGVDVPDAIVCETQFDDLPCLDLYSPAGAYYQPRGKLLVFGDQVDEATIIHEFTHYLVHLDGLSGLTDNDAAHGPKFYARLVDVARTYYGDARRYAWTEDYSHLRTWAERDGYHGTDERQIEMFA